MLFKQIASSSLLALITVYTLVLPFGAALQNQSGTPGDQTKPPRSALKPAGVTRPTAVTVAKPQPAPTAPTPGQAAAPKVQPSYQSQDTPANLPDAEARHTTKVAVAPRIKANPPTVVQAPVRPVQPTANRNSQTVPANPTAAPSNYQFRMLARIISAEAKGEPFEGQVAVGAVILNRVRSGKFPDNIAANVLKAGQFEPVANGHIWNEPTASAVRAAQLAVKGWDPTGGALYFFNPAKSTSRWIWSRSVVTRIGNHVFAV